MIEDRRKKIQLVVAAIGALFVGLIIYGFFFYSPPNPYGDQLRIANLSEFTGGNPTNEDAVQFIQYQLLNTVNMNTQQEYGNNSISDVFVRDDTFSQILEDSLHTVTFLVDIESLQQSYSVSYQWSDDPEVTVEGWGNSVRCPTEEQLIYAPFECTDEFTEYTNTVDETLDKYLPYTSSYYTISYIKSEEETVINVQIMSNNNSTSTRRFFEEYKRAALAWLESKEDIDLTAYTLVYRNFSNEIVAE